VIWTETGSRERAGREVRTVVAPDALAKLRIFVAAPGTSHGTRAAFVVRALDAEGGGDRVDVVFEGTGQ
jgi:hypothetical protein